MNIYFRVDGGNIYSVAMGHIYRCCKLAQYLQETAGVRPVFIMKNFEKGVAKVKEWGFDRILLDPACTLEEDVASTCAHVLDKALVMDVRQFDAASIAALREKIRFLFMFDDLGNNEYMAHAIVNPSVAPKQRAYPKKCADAYYLGAQYFILGNSVFPRVVPGKEVKKIAISLGGADPAGYTVEFAKKTTSLSRDYEFHYVLGFAYGDVEGLKKLIHSLESNAVIHYDVKNLPVLLSTMDMAIVSGGDTCLELAYIGTPGLIIPTISYEMETSAYLEERNVFVNLGDIKEKREEEIIGQIRDFANNYEKRARFSENGKRLIDGKGLERVSQIVIEGLKNHEN